MINKSNKERQEEKNSIEIICMLAAIQDKIDSYRNSKEKWKLITAIGIICVLSIMFFKL